MFDPQGSPSGPPLESKRLEIGRTVHPARKRIHTFNIPSFNAIYHGIYDGIYHIMMVYTISYGIYHRQVYHWAYGIHQSKVVYTTRELNESRMLR